MRKKICGYAVLLAICTPAAALAIEKAQEPSEAELNRVICKRDNVIGSRVQKRRVCMTRAEWVKLENGTRDGVDVYLKRATAGAPRTTGGN